MLYSKPTLKVINMFKTYTVGHFRTQNLAVLHNNIYSIQLSCIILS
jgi:hypothetical protein